MSPSPGALDISKLPQKSAGPHVVAFIERYCVHTIGTMAGKPLLLEDWQKDFLEEMYRLYWDASSSEWRYVYQTILLGVPRGAGKSTLAAALSLYALSPLSGQNAPRVILSASSRENAMNVYGPAVDMVQMSPMLRDVFLANKNTIWCEENRGNLKRISADGKTQFGWVPSFIVRDELHTWTTDRQAQLNEALQTSLVKRENSQSLAVTTAGYDKNTILGELYDRSVKDTRLERPHDGLMVLRDVPGSYLFWWYEAPAKFPVDDPKAWEIANPSKHISMRKLQLAWTDPSTSQQEFEREHLNRWSKAREAWLDVGLWESMSIDAPAHLGELRWIPEGASVQLAIDAALTSDTTALSWAWLEDDGKPVYIDSHVWSALDDVPHDTFIPGGRIDLELIPPYIDDVIVGKYGFQVDEIVYDPRFFEGIARKLSDAGYTVAPMIQSSSQMADAYQSFYVACRSDMLRHRGEKNAVLAEQVNSTGATMTERGWKVFKLKNSKRIDACVAAVMAHSRAYASLERRNRRYIMRRSDFMPPEEQDASQGSPGEQGATPA